MLREKGYRRKISYRRRIFLRETPQVTAGMLQGRVETPREIAEMLQDRVETRKEIAEMTGAPAHLFLFVKVRSNWGNDPERYREMGLEFPKD